MSDVEIKLKEGAELNVEDVARIACALKSLAVYTSMACDEEDSPDELREIVDRGLQSINNLFE
jgi:translation elongation factor EF-1beta